MRSIITCSDTVSGQRNTAVSQFALASPTGVSASTAEPIIPPVVYDNEYREKPSKRGRGREIKKGEKKKENERKQDIYFP